MLFEKAKTGEDKVLVNAYMSPATVLFLTNRQTPSDNNPYMHSRIFFIHILLFLFLTLFISFAPAVAKERQSGLSHIFGYNNVAQNDMSYLPQWLSVLKRHISRDVPEGNCTDSFFNRCHLRNWYHFLDSIRSLSRRKQISAVNRYANKKNMYLT